MNNVCKYLTMSSWLLIILVALDYGLRAFNQSFIMNSSFVIQNMQIVEYLVLAAALWSLYLFVMAVQGQCGGCGSKKSCKC